MKNIFLFCLQFFLLSLCFILIKITDTFAQEKPNKNSTLFWADAGYGYGTLKYHSVSIASLNLGINNMLYMLQIVKGGGSDKWIFANETISVFDISALVGIATLDTNMHASISGGLFYGTGKKTNYISTGGFSNRKEETDISPGLGLAIVGQFFWKAGKVFGIGLKVFISISKESPFSAIALNIAIGDLY